jgi:hypothetical protein
LNEINTIEKTTLVPFHQEETQEAGTLQPRKQPSLEPNLAGTLISDCQSPE